MNWRTTLIVAVLAIVAGVVAIINPFRSEEQTKPRSPWFYQVAREDIETLAIRRTETGASESFHRVDVSSWSFDDPDGIPPSPQRWGGVTLLVSGPGTNRDLTQYAPIIDDPAQYGLDDPQTIVNVGLAGDRQLEFRLGDKTTDGRHHYGQVIGFPDLFLIAASWGDVVARLADEPPLPKWYVRRDPETIRELNLFLGDPREADTVRLEFRNDDGEWNVKKSPDDGERIPVDPVRWEAIRPLVAGPLVPIEVAVPTVDDRDYAPWGITEDSTSFEIRFAGETDTGTRFVDGVLLMLGDKTPEGDKYYAKNQSERFSRQPVLLLDAEWVETLLAFFDDPPYSEDSQVPIGSR